MIRIYHNPRCGTSRKTLELLQAAGVEPEIVLYMDTPLSREELKSLLKMLRIQARDLVRTKEELYKTKYAGQEMSTDRWITAMLRHPELMERPIVVRDGRAALGRPPEAVLELLK